MHISDCASTSSDGAKGLRIFHKKGTCTRQSSGLIIILIEIKHSAQTPVKIQLVILKLEMVLEKLVRFVNGITAASWKETVIPIHMFNPGKYTLE